MKNAHIKGWIGLLLIVAALVGLSACAAAAAIPPTAVPTIAPAPTTAPTAAPAPTTAQAQPQSQTASLKIAQNDKLGKFISDGAGRSLYLFTKDTKDTSNCYDKCAQAWPPLMSTNAPTLGDGIDASLIGSATRKDGSKQVTYNGWPLYYYTPDKNAGDVNGQAVGKVWWVVSPEGNIIKPSGLQVTTNDKLGKLLTDETGRTVYAYTKDTKDTTVCYDKCEVAWPPLLAVGQPTAADGVTASMIGTIQRKDGSMQVTYNGMPLYYWFKDAKAGDTTGQGVGNVWYVVAPDGSVTK